MPTQQECKKILFNLGLKLGVSPRLIATRLLSDEDKEDMVNGLIPLDALETHVKVWMDNKMPDYVNGLSDAYVPLKGKFAK
jgi:hypothetical protein